VEGNEMIDAAVVLAFDAVHDGDGRLDAENTHLYVTNDYASELTRDHPKLSSAPRSTRIARTPSPSWNDAWPAARYCSSGCRLYRTSTRPTSGVFRSMKRWRTIGCRCYATPAASRRYPIGTQPALTQRCSCRRSSAA